MAGTRTYFLYADEGLVAELDETGDEIKTYGYVPDSTWTTDPLFMKVGANYYFYHNDHLGTPQKMTSVNGAIVWSANYEAFGEAAVDAGSTVTNNSRFPGQYYDSETRLHYNLNRYYDPSTGRYLRTDPIGLDGGINLYAYVYNNPINNTDASGLQAVPIPAPVPLPLPSVFIPGTPENKKFAEDTYNAIKKICESRSNDSPETCETKYPELKKCSFYKSKGYYWDSKNHALDYWRGQGIKNVKCDKGRPSTSGPCVGSGKHYRVSARVHGHLGSITSCPCCEDTPSGPNKTKVWRVH